DLLFGHEGADLIDGGSGSDTASYATTSGRVLVNLLINGAQDTEGEGVDTLVSIENLTGSNFNDSLRGNDLGNQLQGGAGDDWLRGYGGNDVLVGEAGSDIIYGHDGDDVLS